MKTEAIQAITPLVLGAMAAILGGFAMVLPLASTDRTAVFAVVGGVFTGSFALAQNKNSDSTN